VPLSARRVLIVEDDEGYQELARLHLKEYDVVVCSSVEDALGAFEKQAFDLVFCDINLLGMTGLELAGQLKARGLDGTPIVLCSSMSDDATRAAAVERGAAGFLAKPYEGDAMRALAKSLLPPSFL
jgi:CheY-like chemotaxis protein